MARIRTIKPEYFTSHDIVSMTPLSRLFYAALWCESDREGRLKWNLDTLKLRYFPADDCNIKEMATELIGKGHVVIYGDDGKLYAHLPNFTHHQVINNRESASILPDPKREGKGKERKGKEVALKSRLSPVKAASIAIPDWLPIEEWNNYLEMRKLKKKPATEAAIKLEINTLEKLKDQGYLPADVLNQSIVKSWTGLFALHQDSDGVPGRVSAIQEAAHEATMDGIKQTDGSISRKDESDIPY